MITKTHYLFPLAIRPWPILGRICAMNLFISMIFIIKYIILSNFYVSIALIIILIFRWCINYSSEINLKGMFSFDLDLRLKSSFVLFIASEVLFFFSLFWAYYHFYSVTLLDTGLQWPPKLVERVSPERVPILGTINLLYSGVFITISHNFLSKGASLSDFRLYLILTIILGANFVRLQLEEFESSFFSIIDSSFGSSFFVLTGFHGIHVLIGVIFLLRVLYRFFLTGAPEDDTHLRFEIAAWYWHFVDVVWLFLFYRLYYLSA